MELYYTLILLFIFSAFTYIDKKHIHFPRWMFFLNIIGMISITCFRGINIGNDTAKYLTLFKAIPSGKVSDFVPRYEVGYIYLNKAIYFLFHNEQSLLIVTGLITWVLVSIFIYKTSENPPYSVFLILTFGFAAFFMSGIRETLAISISLMGFFFIQKKKLVPFILVVVLATMFHRTAIAFILAYPAYHLKLKLKQLILAAGIATTAIVMFDRIVNFFIELFPHYSYYLTGVYFTGGIRLASFLNFLLVLLIFCACRFMCEKYRLEDQCCIGITNLLFVGACILMVSFVFNLLDRVANYYVFFVVIAIPNILLRYKRSTTQWIAKAMFITILFIVYFSCVQYLRPDWNHIYPYQFYVR